MPNPQPPAPSPQPLIVLASSSPRRRELLAEAGYNFVVIQPDEDVECGVCSDSGPAGLVAQLAYRKADAVRKKIQTESPPKPLSPSPPLIIAADTVAECDGFILGKPRDKSDARAMLTQLSGREHRVLSGICLWVLDWSKPIIHVAVTTLRMDQLTETQLNDYLASGQWEGKAGAFGYQDRLGWVKIVEGSESNVVGLPMELLAEMLAAILAKPQTAGEA
jgi:septum formation protein